MNKEKTEHLNSNIMKKLFLEGKLFHLTNTLACIKTGGIKLVLMGFLLVFIQSTKAQNTNSKMPNDAEQKSIEQAAADKDLQGDSFVIKIVDEYKKPIFGAVVTSLKNKRFTATTDEEGNAKFNVQPKGLMKVYIDDLEKTFMYSASSNLVKLTVFDKKINVGFTKNKTKDELTTAIDIVYSDKIEKSSLLNPMESLYGKLKGLMVLQNGGNPWSKNPNLLIRGTATSGSNGVLTIIDGFERSLSTIVVSDIESVAVLKDGTDVSKFGLRGANGVLQITTKRGKKNSFNVDASFDYGYNFPFRKPEFLDSYGYAKAVNQAHLLDGGTNPIYTDQNLEDFRSGLKPATHPNTNWWKETLRDYGFTNNFNTSFYGGGEAINYFVSVNYQNERGLIDNFNLDERFDTKLKYDRLNFRTNLDISITSTTKFLVDASGFIGGQNEPFGGTQPIFDAIYSIPSAAFPVKTQDGFWSGTQAYNNNPVALASSRGSTSPTYRTLYANGRLLQDASSLVKGLSFELAVAYDNYASFLDSKSKTFAYKDITIINANNPTGTIFGAESDVTNSLSFGDQIRHATGLGKINYEAVFGENKFNISALYQEDKRVNDGQYNTFLRQNFMSATSYSYKNKYFIDGVVSYSGTNLLPKNARFGLFPAVSAAWDISREDFLKNNKIVNSLRLRGSWGMSGNDLIPFNNLDRQFFTSGGTYNFALAQSSTTGIREGRLAASGLTFEESEKINIGLSAELLGSLSFSVDAFQDNRTNIIESTVGAVPSILGVTAAFENTGIVQNRGIEGAIMWKKNADKLSYFIGGNFTYARNKVINMNELPPPYSYLRGTGQPIDQQFGLQSIGFFNSFEEIQASPLQVFSVVRPGDVKYKDQNADGKIDELDVVKMGSSSRNPELYYSLNLGFEVHGFGFDALLQGIANQTLYLNTKSIFVPLVGQTNISTFSDSNWTPETAQTATQPRLTLLPNPNNYRANDLTLFSANYLKLRQCEVYYNIPAGLAKSLKVDKMKIYARGMNLFSIDDIKIVDPESTGIIYPTLASYHLGFKIEF